MTAHEILGSHNTKNNRLFLSQRCSGAVTGSVIDRAYHNNYDIDKLIDICERRIGEYTGNTEGEGFKKRSHKGAVAKSIFMRDICIKAKERQCPS